MRGKRDNGREREEKNERTRGQEKGKRDCE
jgi:hypothetical protein